MTVHKIFHENILTKNKIDFFRYILSKMTFSEELNFSYKPRKKKIMRIVLKVGIQNGLE